MNILDCFKLLFLFHAGTSLQMAVKFYYGKKGLSVLRAKTAEETKYSPETSPSPQKRQSEDEPGSSASKKSTSEIGQSSESSSSDEAQEQFGKVYVDEYSPSRLDEPGPSTSKKLKSEIGHAPQSSSSDKAQEHFDLSYAKHLQREELAKFKEVHVDEYGPCTSKQARQQVLVDSDLDSNEEIDDETEWETYSETSVSSETQQIQEPSPDNGLSKSDIDAMKEVINEETRLCTLRKEAEEVCTQILDETVFHVVSTVEDFRGILKPPQKDDFAVDLWKILQKRLVKEDNKEKEEEDQDEDKKK